ncbi:hypothetical protein SCB49_02374 [unidentified eubacterium SCB49]|nr:hypothetical protein SCB49_02374 [unidentified eubacterium SCB49]
MLKTKRHSAVVKMLLFVFLIGTSNTLFANGETPNLSVVKENDSTFAIGFEYKEEMDVKITIKDAFDFTLFKEDAKNVKQINKTFDLKGLPDGKYFLEVENKMNVYSQTIEIKNDKIQYTEDGVTKINKPVSFVKNDTLYVSGDLENDVDVQITIHDKLGEVVHKETTSSKSILNKRFKFIDGRPTDYNVSVTYSDRTFKL